jgi:N-succinyl-L-ornithine transcarbamylase
MITITEYKKTEKPKVVLAWAPHVKALPQAVPNSFRRMDVQSTRRGIGRFYDSSTYGL